jgi:hypothetical protein
LFKQCKVCQHVWDTRQNFVDDPGVTVIGYQANFKDLETGLLFFNHSCKNTIAISADAFSDLYDGPIFEGTKNGTDECPEYCMDKKELRPCPAECECAYVREIIQLFNGAEDLKLV